MQQDVQNEVLSSQVLRSSADEIHVYDTSEYARNKGWTDSQHRLVETITGQLARYNWASAGFLVGSLARGTCDVFSDIDYHVLAPSSGEWFSIIESIAPDAFVGSFGRANERGFPPGAFGLLEDGQKFDVFIHDPVDFSLGTLQDHLPIFDTARSRFPASEPGKSSRGYRKVEPYFPDHSIKSFFFAFEALVQLLCRDERCLAFRNGGIRMETAWVPFFLAENGIEKFDGKRRVASHLNNDQVRILDRLLSFPYDRPALLIDELRWEMSEFTRRGRALADATGSPWPQQLERIVTNKFLTHLPAMTESAWQDADVVARQLGTD